MYTTSFALAALAVVPVLAEPAVNVYWGQAGNVSLGAYCESGGFDYITIGFINNSPEQDQSGLDYPGTNFGGHCAAEVYEKDGNKSQLLRSCDAIAEDIPKCQASGKKVLLSIGGAWINGTNYTVSSPQKGEEFADFLWHAFGPPDPTYVGARPFDVAGDNQIIVDGFDFDIEHKFGDQSGYIALINRLHQYYDEQGGDREYIVTGAPLCPLADDWFMMKTMITEAKFDLLWIQFYNNPVCDAIPGNEPGDSFNYDQWETFIATTKSKDAKLFIGLPGSPVAAGSGYIEPEAAAALMKEYMNRTSFGGAMIWDAYYGSNRTSNNRTYYEYIRDALRGPEGPTPTSSPTGGLTTRTAYTTRVHTITSCPYSAQTCSEIGSVTTEVIPLYTTVYPLSGMRSNYTATKPPKHQTSSSYPCTNTPSEALYSVKPTSTVPSTDTNATTASVTWSVVETNAATRNAIALSLPVLMAAAMYL